jgi:hypothetical protein
MEKIGREQRGTGRMEGEKGVERGGGGEEEEERKGGVKLEAGPAVAFIRPGNLRQFPRQLP